MASRICNENYWWNGRLQSTEVNARTLDPGTANRALGLPHLRRGGLFKPDARLLLRNSTLSPQERYNAMLGSQICARYRKTIATMEINRLKQRPLYNVSFRLLYRRNCCRLCPFPRPDSDQGLRSIAFREPPFSRRMDGWKRSCVYACMYVMML
jgi:hypothetical protein